MVSAGLSSFMGAFVAREHSPAIGDEHGARVPEVAGRRASSSSTCHVEYGFIILNISQSETEVARVLLPRGPLHDLAGVLAPATEQPQRRGASAPNEDHKMQRAMAVLRFVILAVLVGSATIASASVPAADGTYSGCYFKSLGTIRLIDTAIPAQKCVAGFETVVTWSKTGPQGPAGVPGTPGATGAPGANGANGTNVTASAIDPITDSRCGFLGGVEVFQDGVSKAVVCSIQGPAGAPGAPGTPGAPGAKGDMGLTGSPGATGQPGPPGASVSVAIEPPGANCAGGGARISDGSGNVAYSCTGGSGGAPRCTPQGACSNSGKMGCAYDKQCNLGEQCWWTKTTPRFVDNGDGTITDNRTCLMWEKKSPAGTGDLHDAGNLYTWSAATASSNFDGTVATVFLRGLNTVAFAGYSDWRLPTTEGVPGNPNAGDPSHLTGEDPEIESIARLCVDSLPCWDPIFGPSPVNRIDAIYWSGSTVPPGAYALRAFSAEFIGLSGPWVAFQTLGKYVATHARAVRRVP
jgi:hypothetical protein